MAAPPRRKLLGGPVRRPTEQLPGWLSQVHPGSELLVGPPAYRLRRAGWPPLSRVEATRLERIRRRRARLASGDAKRRHLGAIS